MITSVSPAALPFITTSCCPTTTTSATSGLATETRVIAVAVVSGYERPVGRSTRVTSSGPGPGACAAAVDAADSERQHAASSTTSRRRYRRPATRDLLYTCESSD